MTSPPPPGPMPPAVIWAEPGRTACRFHRQWESETAHAGEDWSDPTPEQIAACSAYDPDPEQYGTANR